MNKNLVKQHTEYIGSFMFLFTSLDPKAECKLLTPLDSLFSLDKEFGD